MNPANQAAISAVGRAALAVSRIGMTKEILQRRTRQAGPAGRSAEHGDGDDIGDHHPPSTVGAILRGYPRDYLNAHPKVFSPLFANLLRDPKPCLIHGYFQARHGLSNPRRVGG